MWKPISVENIEMLNGNAPFSASGSACLPSQLPAQLPSRSLGRCRTSVLQSACKSTFWFQNTRKCHSKSCLFLLKQMYSYCQSKANGDCRSQAEIQTSGLTSSQIETRKFILKKRYDTFPWTHGTVEGPPGFCGIQGLFVILLPKGTGRWVHQCTTAASQDATGWAMAFWSAASPRSL